MWRVFECSVYFASLPELQRYVNFVLGLALGSKAHMYLHAQ